VGASGCPMNRTLDLAFISDRSPLAPLAAAAAATGISNTMEIVAPTIPNRLVFTTDSPFTVPVSTTKIIDQLEQARSSTILQMRRAEHKLGIWPGLSNQLLASELPGYMKSVLVVSSPYLVIAFPPPLTGLFVLLRFDPGLAPRRPGLNSLAPTGASPVRARAVQGRKLRNVWQKSSKVFS